MSPGKKPSCHYLATGGSTQELHQLPLIMHAAAGFIQIPRLLRGHFGHFPSPSWGSTQDLRLQRTATTFVRPIPFCFPALPPNLPDPQERRRTDRCMPGTICCCLLVFRTLSTASTWWRKMPKWLRKKFDTMWKPFIGDSEIICLWTPCCMSTGPIAPLKLNLRTTGTTYDTMCSL